MTETDGGLQRWSCYVDAIEPTCVTLVMREVPAIDPGGGDAIGRFPKGLLSHLDYALGTYLTVTVSADRGVVIEHSRAVYGPPSALHLVDMLRRPTRD